MTMTTFGLSPRSARNTRRAAAALAAAIGGALPLAAQSARSGNVLVANQRSENASLIDLRTDSMRFIPVGVGPHEAIVSPSGRIGLVTVYGLQSPPGNELAIIDMKTGTVTKRVSLGEYVRPHGAMFMPRDESRVIVTSEATQKIVVVNIEKGVVEAAIPTGATGSHMVGVTADGTRAWTSNIFAGSVSEMDLVKKELVRVIPTGPRTEGIAVAPDGSTVWAGSNTNATVAVIDAKTGATIETLGGFTMPYRIAISADGKTAIVCDPQASAIHVLDVATRKLLWRLDGLAGPRGVSIAADGKTAYVTLADDPSVAIVDLVARKLVRKVGVGASPDGVGAGPTGT
jgi:DNA-binding beta-propeller fold protein YncE